METYDLSIRLEEPQRLYRAGETISGQVRVETQADELICERLTVAISYDVQGKKAIDGSPLCWESVTLFRGTVPPKTAKAYAFALVVPEAPAPYKGKLFRATNVVKAELEIAFLTNATALVPYRFMQTSARHVGAIERKASRPSLWAALFLGGFPLVLGIALLPLLTETDGWYVPWLSLTMGLVTLLQVFRTWLIRKQIAYGVVRIERADVCQGEHFVVCVEVRPRYDLFVNWVVIRLVGQEILMVRDSEGRTEGEVYEFSKVERKNREVGWLRANQPYSWRFEVEVPLHAPVSTCSPKGDPAGLVRWEVCSELDAENCPDWNENIVVIVNPRARASTKARL